MRTLFIVTALAFLVGALPEIREAATNYLEPEIDPRVEVAIELRCAEEIPAFRDDCARELRQDFEVGAREPEEIVRLHCTRIESDWAIHTRSPMPICDELYGGWIKG